MFSLYSSALTRLAAVPIRPKMIRILPDLRTSFAAFPAIAWRKPASLLVVRAVWDGIGGLIPHALQRLPALMTRRVATTTTSPAATTLLADLLLVLANWDARVTGHTRHAFLQRLACGTGPFLEMTLAATHWALLNLPTQMTLWMATTTTSPATMIQLADLLLILVNWAVRSARCT